MVFVLLAIALLINVALVAGVNLFRDAARLELEGSFDEWPKGLREMAGNELGEKYNPRAETLKRIVSMLSLPSLALFAGYYFVCIVQIEWGWVYALVLAVLLIGNIRPVFDRSDTQPRARVHSVLMMILSRANPASNVNNYIVGRQCLVTLVSLAGIATLYYSDLG